MELHDEPGQALMYLKFQLGSIAKNLGEKGNSSRVDCEVMVNYVDGIIDSVRRLSRDLGPSVLEELGLSSGLRYLLEEFSERYSLQDSQVEIDEIDDLFPPQDQLSIFRILQESLTNIFRHAQASRVSVSVKKQNGTVSLVVEDNGRGFDLQQTLAAEGDRKGIGIAALQERVRILGGTLDIWSRMGVGTRIACQIPVAGEPSRYEAIPNFIG
jgi:signal transduction histidine kinase